MMMDSLSRQKENKRYEVKKLQGSARFISRITSIGLTIGTTVEVVQNRKGNPLLLFARDTMIAISKKETENILVEEV
jgi:ferrous iron transport protein A